MVVALVSIITIIMVEIKEAIEAAGALEVVGIPAPLTLSIETNGGIMSERTEVMWVPTKQQIKLMLSTEPLVMYGGCRVPPKNIQQGEGHNEPGDTKEDS